MKSTRLHWFLIGLMISTIDVVQAEGNCPAGYYPIGAPQGQQGPQGCAPIANDSHEQQAPVQRPPQWVDRWGAIATYEPNGSFGAATNEPSQYGAENTAMAICHSQHGSACRLELSYRNQCAALVASDKGYNTNAAPTENEAIQKGINICNDAGNPNCFAYYSACSLPKRSH